MRFQKHGLKYLRSDTEKKVEKDTEIGKKVLNDLCVPIHEEDERTDRELRQEREERSYQ